MSGVWDFLKRHRGKIAAGAVVAGGAFVVQQLWRNSSLQLSRDTEFNQSQLKVSVSYLQYSLYLCIFLIFTFSLVEFCFSLVESFVYISRI